MSDVRRIPVGDGARPRPLEVIAHRGFSGVAPENTLAAFRRAIEAGADRVELDAQLAADGVPVVLHDDDLERTAGGEGPLWRRTAAELARLDAGGWFGEDFRGEAIPTLAEALELCAGAIPVNVELKVPAGLPDPPGWAARLAAAAAAEIDRLGLAPTTIVSSFDPVALAAFAGALPGVPRETLHDAAAAEGGPGGADPLDRSLERALAVGSSGLSVSLEELRRRPGLPAKAHALGLRLKVYTVDDLRAMEEVRDLGVDGVFTNFPDRLIALLAGQGRASPRGRSSP